MKSMASILQGLNALADAACVDSTQADAEKTAQGMAKRGYRFDEQSFTLVKRYCSGRGLAISGGVGVGKTYFFVCLGLPILNLKIAQCRTLADMTRALDSYRNEPIVIDDVGSETSTFKNFGTQVNLLEVILEYRLDASAPTHMTLNLTPEQLLAMYGERMVDRMTQLCDLVVLEGESHRSPTNNRFVDSVFNDFFLGRVWKTCDGVCRFYDSQEHKCMKGRTHEPRIYTRPGYDSGEPNCPYFN